MVPLFKALWPMSTPRLHQEGMLPPMTTSPPHLTSSFTSTLIKMTPSYRHTASRQPHYVNHPHSHHPSQTLTGETTTYPSAHQSNSPIPTLQTPPIVQSRASTLSGSALWMEHSKVTPRQKDTAMQEQHLFAMTSPKKKLGLQPTVSPPRIQTQPL